MVSYWIPAACKSPNTCGSSSFVVGVVVVAVMVTYLFCKYSNFL